MPWHSFCHNCEFERNCRYFPSLKIWLVPLFCYCSTVYSFFFFLLNYFKARDFSGLKILWFRGWNLKSAKLKCHQHNRKAKMPQNKVSRPKHKIKMPQEKPFKKFICEKTMLQKCIFMFGFPETLQNRTDFSEARFLYVDGRKTRPDSLQ